MKKAIIYSVLFMMFAAPCSAQSKWLKKLEEIFINPPSSPKGKPTSESKSTSTSSSLKESGSEEVLQYSMETAPAYTAPREQQMRIVTNNPNFKVKITRCAASGKTVLLELMITNVSGNDAENVTCRRGAIEAYDEQGNVYGDRNVTIKFANQQFTDWHSWNYTLLADVPVKLTLKIEGVATQAEMLSRVTIPFRHDGLGLKFDTPVTLRNIPISRD